MTTVKNILQSKSNEIWSTSPDTLVFDALKVMAEKNIGALLVMEADKLAGIFSERDYARKVALKGETSHNTVVRNVMTADVVSVAQDQPIEKCMTLMTDNHIRHLPVLEGDKLKGMISIGDVVKALISQHEDTIKQLENYITGKR
ncbi:MAG: CBS domain-containing protein [Bacteroidetes bacterium]|nr:CBS domain-containing protein [Bacteroidota bacterium]